MIAVDKQGRLGNQMFQYAFGVTAAKRLGTRLAYDTCELERYFELLDPHPVRAATRLAVRLSDRLHAFDRREFVVDDREDPDSILESVTNRTFYGGFFYSAHFFRPAASAVRRAFSVRDVHLERFEAKYADVLAGRYIAAHVRLTDFFTFRDDVTLPPGYYLRSLDELDPDLPVIVVSDDPDRVRAAFGSSPRIRVEANDEIMDFLLLKHASELVSSNSSFAWWAAWLNEQPGLRVIAPRWWLGLNSKSEFPVKAVPEEWQQIDPRNPEDGTWPLP